MKEVTKRRPPHINTEVELRLKINFARRYTTRTESSRISKGNEYLICSSKPKKLHVIERTERWLPNARAFKITHARNGSYHSGAQKI